MVQKDKNPVPKAQSQKQTHTKRKPKPENHIKSFQITSPSRFHNDTSICQTTFLASWSEMFSEIACKKERPTPPKKRKK